MTRLSIIPLLLALAACAPVEVRYAPVPLPMPERPELPRIQAEDVRCLSDDAWATIVRREQALRHYAEEFEAIIRANNEKTQAQRRRLTE